MSTASPSCFFWWAGKANVQGLFTCLLSVYWTLLLFPCRHNDASGAEKSRSNRQSHFFHRGKCKWQQGKNKQTKHSFGIVVNNNSVYVWHLKASYSKRKPPCASLCELVLVSMCSCEYMCCQRMWRKSQWGVHDRRMKWPVLIVSDRAWSAVIFALKLLQSADHSQALNQKLLTRVIIQHVCTHAGRGTRSQRIHGLSWQVFIRGKPVSRPRPNCVLPATYTITAFGFVLMWRDSQGPQRWEETGWAHGFCFLCPKDPEHNPVKCICCSPPQNLDCLLEPCVCILRKLVYADPPLRHSLAQRNLLLLTLLRGTFTRQLIK